VLDKLKEVIAKKYPNQRTLIKLWIDIFIFKTKTIEQFNHELGISFSNELEIFIYKIDATKYINNFFKELSRCNKLYEFNYGVEGRIKLLYFLYEGEENLLSEIKLLLNEKRLKKNDLIDALHINKKVLNVLFTKYDIRLPYKVYSPEGKILASRLEKIIEDILHKYNISHKYNVTIVYDKRNKRKRYIPDWRIRIGSKRTLVELFGYYGNDYRKRAKEKMDFYKVKGFNAIAFFKQDLDDEEALICKIENYLGVQIARV
jgi:hypothetical protein